MNTDLLFAIDTNTTEVIVSESPKGTSKVNFIIKIRSSYRYNYNLSIAESKTSLLSLFK